MTKWSSVLDFEEMIGRSLVVDRQAYAWDGVFPDAYEYWSRDQGHILSLEWNAQYFGGDVVKWADIASGRYDATIDATASRIKAFGSPAFFVFHHEPEDEIGQAGTAKDFINAYRHIHDRFDADGVTNLSYGLQLLASTYRYGDPDAYYPGDTYVDVLAADGYNWYNCPGHTQDWSSFQDIFAGFHDYGLEKDKPMYVAEWGSVEDPLILTRKAQWILGAAVTVQSWPEIKVVAYYQNGPPSTDCNWRLESSTLSLAAFQVVGTDPYFNPPVPQPEPSSIAAYVSVSNSYSSPVGYPAQGKSVEWLFDGPGTHTVTDNSGMGLFDSGVEQSGGTFTFPFRAAGIYTYHCTVRPSMTATIRVPLLVSPPSGRVNTTFTVTWASGRPPSGYVYDVQVKRPGSSSWDTWQDDVTSSTGSFVPDAGKGTYTFQSRISNSANGEASWYAEEVTISVS
jgi:hypothetical protein